MQTAFFLAGNYVGNGVGIDVAFKNLFTLGSYYYSDEQRDKQQESVREEKQQNLRNFCRKLEKPRKEKNAAISMKNTVKS